MTPQEYLEFTRTTVADTLKDETLKAYVYAGVRGEAGELCDKAAKAVRDGGGAISPEAQDGMLKECGDIMWMLAQAHDLGWIGLPGRWPVRTFKGAALHDPVGVTFACGELDDAVTDEVQVEPGFAVSVWGRLATVSAMLGSTLEDVAARNVAKLSARVTAGTIHGEGDER